MKEIRIMVRIEGSGQSLQRFFNKNQNGSDKKAIEEAITFLESLRGKA